MVMLTLATRNSHKTAEIRAMLSNNPNMQVRDTNDIVNLPAVEETGTTFLANASLKAIAISRSVTGLVLADDSGLEVDALNGEPGVWSSSFGGEEGNHEKNNQRLQQELLALGTAPQRARFRCVMVLAESGIVLAHFDGSIEGVVTAQPRGSGGFGYDPHFIPEGHEQSFAELGESIKNQLSHRAKALSAAMLWLNNHYQIA